MVAKPQSEQAKTYRQIARRLMDVADLTRAEEEDMSLYVEDYPAEDGDVPQPPLLTAVPAPVDQDVTAKALASVATAEVGTVLYSEAAKVLDLAVVLGRGAFRRPPDAVCADDRRWRRDWRVGPAGGCGHLSASGVYPVEPWACRCCLDRGRSGGRTRGCAVMDGRWGEA